MRCRPIKGYLEWGNSALSHGFNGTGNMHGLPQQIWMLLAVITVLVVVTLLLQSRRLTSRDQVVYRIAVGVILVSSGILVVPHLL